MRETNHSHALSTMMMDENNTELKAVLTYFGRSFAWWKQLTIGDRMAVLKAYHAGETSLPYDKMSTHTSVNPIVINANNRYIERMALGEDCINDCSHPGPCDDDIAFWTKKLQLTVDRETVIPYLRGFGAWTQEELDNKTDEQLAHMVLWNAACSFRDDKNETCYYVGG